MLIKFVFCFRLAIFFVFRHGFSLHLETQTQNLVYALNAHAQVVGKLLFSSSSLSLSVSLCSAFEARALISANRRALMWSGSLFQVSA